MKFPSPCNYFTVKVLSLMKNLCGVFVDPQLSYIDVQKSCKELPGVVNHSSQSSLYL